MTSSLSSSKTDLSSFSSKSTSGSLPTALELPSKRSLAMTTKKIKSRIWLRMMRRQTCTTWSRALSRQTSSSTNCRMRTMRKRSNRTTIIPCRQQSQMQVDKSISNKPTNSSSSMTPISTPRTLACLTNPLVNYISSSPYRSRLTSKLHIPGLSRAWWVHRRNLLRLSLQFRHTS